MATNNLLGTQAPNFLLKDKDGKPHALNLMHGDFFVVYFYPKDDTPGCTIEAKEFTAHLSKFKRLNVPVIGISGGDEKTKKKFCEKHKLSVLLLSDPDFSVCKAYGAYGKKSFLGKQFMGILRTTFLLDKSKKIIKVYENVKPETHVVDVLKDILPRISAGKH